MWKVMKMSEKWFATRVGSDNDEEMNYIREMTGNGTPVIFVDELGDLPSIGLTVDVEIIS